MPGGHCSKCGAHWASAATLHCSDGCHLNFGSTDAFDRHRIGLWDERMCIPEADFSKPYGKAQRPMLVKNDSGAYVRPAA